MADILVQNAVEQVKSAIANSSSGYNYTEMVGDTLTNVVKAAIEASPTVGPYTTSGGSSSSFLCDLSHTNKISRCTCNYFGSSTNCGVSSPNTNNLWMDGTVLVGSGSGTAVNQQDIVDDIRVINTQAMKYINELYSLDTALLLDQIYYSYLELKSIFVAEGNTDVKTNWYGLGGGGEIQGARISNTNYLKVCGSGQTWVCGYGASCTWTVPSGVTRVKFQVWGAGHGSNPGCCCGGQSWGSTGAYAEMTMDATPGESYTVCAGCSCNKRCCSNDTTGCGCASGVTGPGICCLFADGAGCYTENCNNMNLTRCEIGLGSACYRFQNFYCSQGGSCWCSYGEYCHGGSCDTCGMIGVYPNCCYQNPCSCACSNRNAIDQVQRTHRGIHGGGCFDTNHYGRMTAHPIIDADTGLNWNKPGNGSVCYCAYYDSGSCCGGCTVTGSWDWHPGYGGAYTHVMGGSNTHKGDTGRGGMVQISWS